MTAKGKVERTIPGEAERLDVVEGEVRSLREGFEAFLEKNKRMEEALAKRNLTVRPQAPPEAAAAKKSSRKRKKGRRKGGTQWGRVVSWGRRHSIGILVGSTSVATLLSVSIVWGGIGGGSPSSLPKRTEGFEGPPSFDATSDEAGGAVPGVVAKGKGRPATASANDVEFRTRGLRADSIWVPPFASEAAADVSPPPSPSVSDILDVVAAAPSDNPSAAAASPTAVPESSMEPALPHSAPASLSSPPTGFESMIYPTDSPTYYPTPDPTHAPTSSSRPTLPGYPTSVPTSFPTYAPGYPTSVPTDAPFFPTLAPTFAPTSSPRPTLPPGACSADEPCEENYFCTFDEEGSIRGTCEKCPSKKMTCHNLDHGKEGIADCSLQCDRGLVCGNDNQVCGCSSVQQSDYRGSISRTEEGNSCKNWESFIAVYVGEDYYNWPCLLEPSVDLVENHCRNPGKDENERNTGPWCGNPDKKEFLELCKIPACDPCSCEKPDCLDTETLQSCHCVESIEEIAKDCCPKGADDHVECKCNHRMAACHKSIQHGDTDHLCHDVINDCCKKDKDPESCKCTMWEGLCHDYPQYEVCANVPDICCRYLWNDSEICAEEEANCQCDFYRYAETVLDYEDFPSKSNACNRARGEHTTTTEDDRAALVKIYKSTKGKGWDNNSGWFEETDSHCEWFGITCGDEGFVIEIDLSNNTLTGVIDQSWGRDGPPLPFMLESLILKQNNLSGPPFEKNVFHAYRKLKHVDISQNSFNGAVDLVIFPAVEHLNVSHNKLQSVKKYRRFGPANEVLRIVDLSNNVIDQDVADIFDNIPPNMAKLILTSNQIRGDLPRNLPALMEMTHLSMGNNNLNGTLPDAHQSLPQLRRLDLSNQKNNGGLTGPIPAGFSNKRDLTELNLANNRLDGKVPSFLGNLPVLAVLNLSNNEFSGSIPAELGKLEGSAEILDLSNNELEGQIPSSLGNFRDASVLMSGNMNIMDAAQLAPLSLYAVRGFDLRNDAGLCPKERNALKDIFESSNGLEWTRSDNWADEYQMHCDWYNVACDSSNNTIKLQLRNNGLSGQLSKSIAELSSIEEIDLSDNSIKGKIPEEIASLSKLTYLGLSHNVFSGTVPVLGNTTHPKRVHLHGNRLAGSIILLLSDEGLNMKRKNDEEKSDFVADCGVPSIYAKTLDCKNCTMCCNAMDDCYPNEETDIQKVQAPYGFGNYRQFTFVFFFTLIGFFCVLHLALLIHDQYKNRNLTRERRSSLTARDSINALETIGTDSVYQFFLGTSWLGWAIALGVMAMQLGFMFIFVKGAEVELGNDNTDLVYTWKCARMSYDCRDTKDLDWQGWTVFALLMATHLLKDIINGSKLVIQSAKQRHSPRRKIRLFLGGLFLSSVSLFTLLVTTIYNKAIATSNTGIVVNSVIILFVTDIDELVRRILMTLNPSWVKSDKVTGQKSHTSGSTENHLEALITENSSMKINLENVEAEMDELRAKLLKMEKHMGLGKANLVVPHNVRAQDQGR